MLYYASCEYNQYKRRVKTSNYNDSSNNSPNDKLKTFNTLIEHTLKKRCKLSSCYVINELSILF